MNQFPMIEIPFDVKIDGRETPIASLVLRTPESFADCIAMIEAGDHPVWSSVVEFYQDAVANRKVKMASKAKATFLAEQKGSASKSRGLKLKG